MNIEFKRLQRHALALATALALAACGGGGGSDSGTSGGGSTGGTGGAGGSGTIDTTPYAQQTSATAATYTGTDDNSAMESATYSTLNTVRLAANAGAINQDTHLDTAARAHSAYILANATEFGHTEIQGHTGFTGTNPSDRITAAGYAGTLFSEGVSGYAIAVAPNADNCPKNLLNSMYHLASILGPYRDLGVGYKTDNTGAGYCVLDYANKTKPQYPAAGTLITYPYKGQTGVTWAFSPATESPRPPAVLASVVGTPIYASMGSLAVVTGDSSSKGSVDTFVIKDAGGNVVPAYVIAPPSITLASGIETMDDSANSVYYPSYGLFLVPKAALVPNATYTVTFSGKYNGVAHAASWSFTTSN